MADRQPYEVNSPGEDEHDPTSYAYWRAHGYRGRPPWRRGYRWSYLAISLALAVVLGAVFVLAANGRL